MIYLGNKFSKNTLWDNVAFNHPNQNQRHFILDNWATKVGRNVNKTRLRIISKYTVRAMARNNKISDGYWSWFTHVFHSLYSSWKQTLKCKRNVNMNVYISSNWSNLDICKLKTPERNTNEINPNLWKFSVTITTPAMPSSHPISDILLSSLPRDSLCLNPKHLPLSCFSNENVPQRSGSFWVTHSLNLLPRNLSLNIQSPARPEFHLVLATIHQ